MLSANIFDVKTFGTKIALIAIVLSVGQMNYSVDLPSWIDNFKKQNMPQILDDLYQKKVVLFELKDLEQTLQKQSVTVPQGFDNVRPMLLATVQAALDQRYQKEMLAGIANKDFLLGLLVCQGRQLKDGQELLLMVPDLKKYQDKKYQGLLDFVAAQINKQYSDLVPEAKTHLASLVQQAIQRAQSLTQNVFKVRFSMTAKALGLAKDVKAVTSAKK